MKKILLSVAVIAFAGTAVAGLTGAFYKDVERSSGNTFTAGSLDLKVDNESHYNGMVCKNMGTPDNPDYQWQPEVSGVVADYPVQGTLCGGTWLEQDLIPGVHMFFDFTDLKPGDFGENTLSLHVYDNDAWARIRIENAIDSDNGCVEPEIEDDPDCTVVDPDADGNGELDNYLDMVIWLDQGEIPGFQNGDKDPDDSNYDQYEGDNIRQVEGDEFDFTEPLIDETLASIEIDPGTGDIIAYNLWATLTNAYNSYGCATNGEVDGHNKYGVCHGLALDGRFVKSTTYYFGVAWDFDLDAGNEVQTDTLVSDVSFDVVQHRNNPGKTF